MLTRTAKLTYESAILALGLLLPQVFHLAGGAAAGSIFLPMHIPVLLAGLLLGVKYGALTGIALPLMSSLLTGMPSPVKLPFMVAELTMYGVVCGLTNKKNVYVSLVLALTAGRLTYAAVLGIAFAAGFSVPAPFTVATALVTGLPGIVIQILFVPPIVLLIRRVSFHGAPSKKDQRTVKADG